MKSHVKKTLSSQGAQALSEILISVAIASIIGLGIASFAAYGADQFNVLVDQNLAEKSIVQAAFYLRSYLSQAVTTSCVGVSPFYGPVVGIGAPAATPPAGIAQGQVDCRAIMTWTANAYNPIAIFNRENGGSPTMTTIPFSSFQGVGVYFTPPNGSTSGILTFAQAAAGALTVQPGVNSFSFDRLVDVQILSGSVSENLNPSPATTPINLKSISYVVTGRYFTTQSAGGFDYSVGTALPTSLYRDITMEVAISFHDNYLGIDNTGGNYSERLDGGLYFFKFTSPEINGL